MDFMMRKRIVDGETAFELGLVHEVVSDNNLMEETLTLARELADGPQVAMRMLKRSILLAADQRGIISRRDSCENAVTTIFPTPGAQRRSLRNDSRFNGWLEGREDPPMDGPAVGSRQTVVALQLVKAYLSESLFVLLGQSETGTLSKVRF